MMNAGDQNQKHFFHHNLPNVTTSKKKPHRFSVAVAKAFHKVRRIFYSKRNGPSFSSEDSIVASVHNSLRRHRPRSLQNTINGTITRRNSLKSKDIGIINTNSASLKKRRNSHLRHRSIDRRHSQSHSLRRYPRLVYQSRQITSGGFLSGDDLIVSSTLKKPDSYSLNGKDGSKYISMAQFLGSQTQKLSINRNGTINKFKVKNNSNVSKIISTNDSLDKNYLNAEYQEKNVNGMYTKVPGWTHPILLEGPLPKSSNNTVKESVATENSKKYQNENINRHSTKEVQENEEENYKTLPLDQVFESIMKKGTDSSVSTHDQEVVINTYRNKYLADLGFPAFQIIENDSDRDSNLSSLSESNLANSDSSSLQNGKTTDKPNESKGTHAFVPYDDFGEQRTLQTKRIIPEDKKKRSRQEKRKGNPVMFYFSEEDRNNTALEKGFHGAKFRSSSLSSISSTCSADKFKSLALSPRKNGQSKKPLKSCIKKQNKDVSPADGWEDIIEPLKLKFKESLSNNKNISLSDLIKENSKKKIPVTEKRVRFLIDMETAPQSEVLTQLMRSRNVHTSCFVPGLDNKKRFQVPNSLIAPNSIAAAATKTTTTPTFQKLQSSSHLGYFSSPRLNTYCYQSHKAANIQIPEKVDSKIDETNFSNQNLNSLNFSKPSSIGWPSFSPSSTSYSSPSSSSSFRGPDSNLRKTSLERNNSINHHSHHIQKMGRSLRRRPSLISASSSPCSVSSLNSLPSLYSPLASSLYSPLCSPSTLSTSLTESPKSANVTENSSVFSNPQPKCTNRAVGGVTYLNGKFVFQSPPSPLAVPFTKGGEINNSPTSLSSGNISNHNHYFGFMKGINSKYYHPQMAAATAVATATTSVAPPKATTSMDHKFNNRSNLQKKSSPSLTLDCPSPSILDSLIDYNLRNAITDNIFSPRNVTTIPSIIPNKQLV